MASFGAKLFPASASLPDDALHARFEGFVVEHPEAVGLAPGVSPQDLDLVPAQGFRAPAGKIVLLRFDQRYREIPVYGPDGTVRVTLAPGGAIAFDGAIVDGREVWANLDQQASEDVARRSILVHAAERSGRPAEALEVAGLRQVAVPRVQRIGWVGTVRGPGFAWASMLLLGLVGARRRGHRRRDGVTAMLALMLAGSSIHGCCDSAVATEASLTSESSTTSDSSASESTGEPGLPLWALGVFSDQTNRVGTTIDNPLWYVWSNIEITASGSMIYDQYVCSTPRERQEFRWTLAADRQSLSLQPVPPSELFTFGSDDFISEVIIEPGDSCDAIAIRYFSRDAMQWFEAEYLRGEVCAEPTDPDGCAFTFEWCDGVPPTACE